MLPLSTAAFAALENTEGSAKSDIEEAYDGGAREKSMDPPEAAAAPPVTAALAA